MPYKDPGLMELWVLTHMKKSNEILYIKEFPTPGLCSSWGDLLECLLQQFVWVFVIIT